MTQFLLLATLLCASPEAVLDAAKETYLAAVIAAEDEFIQALDRKVAEVLETDLDGAVRLKKLKEDLQLGLFTASDDPVSYAEQRRYLEAVEDAASKLSAAYDQAQKSIGAAGDLELALKVRREHEQFLEGTYEPSIADAKGDLILGRYLGELKVMTSLHDQRIPDELTITAKRRHIVVSGTGKSATLRVDGKRVGWFGKAVAVKHRRPMNGLMRSTVPPEYGHIWYSVAFLKGDRAIDSVPLVLDANVTYEWSLKNVRGVLHFVLTKDGKVELERKFSGNVNLGFSASVRYPGDRADLRIAF